MRWAVVVPTNRPKNFCLFLEAWHNIFTQNKVFLIVVEDGPSRSDAITAALESYGNYKHLCWDDVPDFMPRRTDMVRSAGILAAYREAADYIATLDDDTLPVMDIFDRYGAEFDRKSVLSNYFSVGALTTSKYQMRGFPYGDRFKRDVAVQYGGWHGVLDYDAANQLANPELTHAFFDAVVPIPKGTGVTCCIMNAAWKKEYTPIMWQLPMLNDKYNRYGDIWSGLFIKRTLDAVGAVLLINGKASVRHQRASNPFNNLKREAPGAEINEYLFDNLIQPKTDHLIDAYRQVTDSAADYFAQYDKDYAEHFTESRDQWLKSF